MDGFDHNTYRWQEEYDTQDNTSSGKKREKLKEMLRAYLELSTPSLKDNTQQNINNKKILKS